MIGYRISWECDIQRLETDVKGWIAKVWLPQGGMVVTRREGGTLDFNQTMIYPGDDTLSDSEMLYEIRGLLGKIHVCLELLTITGR